MECRFNCKLQRVYFSLPHFLSPLSASPQQLFHWNWKRNWRKNKKKKLLYDETETCTFYLWRSSLRHLNKSYPMECLDFFINIPKFRNAKLTKQNHIEARLFSLTRIRFYSLCLYFSFLSIFSLHFSGNPFATISYYINTLMPYWISYANRNKIKWAKMSFIHTHT